MKQLSRNAIIGYPAGIITGITYGLKGIKLAKHLSDGYKIYL